MEHMFFYGAYLCFWVIVLFYLYIINKKYESLKKELDNLLNRNP